MWLVWIISGTIFLPGIIGAVCHSTRQIFGDSDEAQCDDFEEDIELGTIPSILLRMGIYIMILLLPEIFPYRSPGPVDIIGIIIMGGILGMIHTIISVMVGGFLVDERVILIAGEISGGMIAGTIAGGLFAGGLLFSYAGFVEFVLGMMIGIIGGGVAGGMMLFVFLVTTIITEIFSSAISPLLSLLRFKTILCNHCLRYTHPLWSRYIRGNRYCEHCYEEVEWTKAPGNLIFTFGNFQQHREGRVFVLSNPDLERKEQPVDVSEVYIDTQTSEIYLLEQFITYIINYPPTHGVRSVRIFYRGDLDNLGKNLRNALQNNFEHVACIR